MDHRKALQQHHYMAYYIEQLHLELERLHLPRRCHSLLMSAMDSKWSCTNELLTAFTTVLNTSQLVVQSSTCAHAEFDCQCTLATSSSDLILKSSGTWYITMFACQYLFSDCRTLMQGPESDKGMGRNSYL